ncbi:DnaJ domain-containing protein [Cinnamomum micranthum f. kanehirae]|uniref:DnaJ domain-containing protein n=1 Tax=Cinnamomum micranthum f. kanehirae TaxID=337451 RepID=A0A3S3NSZ5_9MAGN|nr:DnaJ domain-containing protein [Cinnamomum micranthum f. kanehirae]
MYTAMKIASNSPHVASISLRAALFHSTPVSDRKRRTHWDSGVGSFRDSSKRHNSYAKKVRKMGAKQTLLRNINAYADHLFEVRPCLCELSSMSSLRHNSFCSFSMLVL